jgi:hypothetical protein
MCRLTLFESKHRGVLRPLHPRVPFSCSPEEKGTKEKGASDGANTPSPPQLWGPALSRRDLLSRVSGADFLSAPPFGALAQRLTVLGRAK